MATLFKGNVRLDRFDDNGFGAGWAGPLTDTTADAPCGENFYGTGVVDAQRFCAQWAVVEANPAIVVVAANASALVYCGQTHTDLLKGEWAERAAGAGAHTVQAVAGDAGLVGRIDIGSTAVLGVGFGIDLDRLGGTDFGALATVPTGVGEIGLGQGAGWPQSGGLLRQVFFGVIGCRVGDSLEKLAKEIAAIWCIHRAELAR